MGIQQQMGKTPAAFIGFFIFKSALKDISKAVFIEGSFGERMRLKQKIRIINFSSISPSKNKPSNTGIKNRIKTEVNIQKHNFRMITFPTKSSFLIFPFLNSLMAIASVLKSIR